MPMKPTIVQIAAHNPDIALQAALLILEKSGSFNANEGISPVAAIDLNLGESDHRRCHKYILSLIFPAGLPFIHCQDVHKPLPEKENMEHSSMMNIQNWPTTF